MPMLRLLLGLTLFTIFGSGPADCILEKNDESFSSRCEFTLRSIGLWNAAAWTFPEEVKYPSEWLNRQSIILSNATRSMRTEVSELSGSTPGRNATKIFQQPMPQRYQVAYGTYRGTLDDTQLTVDWGPSSFSVGCCGLRAPR